MYKSIALTQNLTPTVGVLLCLFVFCSKTLLGELGEEKLTLYRARSQIKQIALALDTKESAPNNKTNVVT